MAEVNKCWKLTECAAHPSGQVTCLSLGQASGSILATGGEDKLVKLWAVGRTTCVMSLSGHTSSIESLRFNLNEDKLAAGSMSGVIKTWDLNEAKLMRSLSGHKASVAALDLHPYGDFAVSGCVDGSAKLWDIRRKGCIYTYKGHTQPVRTVKFSPDGRWIVTAGDDAVIKIWDLESGKILSEFNNLGAAASDVAFHPSVLLMAVAMQDRTVQFLDLEVFQSIGSTVSSDMSTPPKRVTFNPDGSSLYASSGDTVKIISVEPACLLETVAVGWGKHSMGDMVVSARHGQLIGAGYAHSNVATFVVDVKNCAPFVQPAAAAAPAAAPAAAAAAAAPSSTNSSDRPTTTSGRKSFPQPQAGLIPKSKPQKQRPSVATPDDEAGAETQILDPQAYRDIFAPKKALRRSPSPSDEAGDKPFTPPTKDCALDADTSPANNNNNAKLSPASARRQQQQQQQQASPTKARDANNLQRQATAAAVKQQATAGIAVDDFLPKQPSAAAASAAAANNQSDSELLQQFHNPHQSLISVITSRHHQLQRVQSLWQYDSVRAAIDCALLMHDDAVLIDVINILLSNQSLWTLELSSSLLPSIANLFCSKYAAYVEAAAAAALLILKQFASLIKFTVSAPAVGVGIDISREERMERCRVCYDALMRINKQLSSGEVLGKAGQNGREVKMLLMQLQM